MIRPAILPLMVNETHAREEDEEWEEEKGLKSAFSEFTSGKYELGIGMMVKNPDKLHTLEEEKKMLRTGIRTGRYVWRGNLFFLLLLLNSFAAPLLNIILVSSCCSRNQCFNPRTASVPPLVSRQELVQRKELLPGLSLSLLLLTPFSPFPAAHVWRMFGKIANEEDETYLIHANYCMLIIKSNQQ